MSNTVTLKKSSVVGKIPQSSDLAFGEVALNFADGRLYYRNSSDQIEFFEKSTESEVGFSILETDADLGSINDDNITSFLDAGSITETVANEYDLGSIAISGYISPNIFVLPNYDSSYIEDGYVASGYVPASTLPEQSTSGQLAYVNYRNTLAFSDGNGWTELSTVATTGLFNDLLDAPDLSTVATTGSYNDLINAPDLSTVATTGSYNDLVDTPDLSVYATETYVNTEVANLVGSAPETLDTLNELAQALDSDPNFATTITNQLSLKADSSSLATVATTGSYNDLSDTPTVTGVSTGKAIAMAIVFG